MRMSDLLRELPIERAGGSPGAAADPEIRGIAHDSRRVGPGDLFVAWRGAKHDGHEHVAEALTRGAVAVLAAAPRPAEIRVPWLSATDPRRLLGPLAARLYGHPDRELLHVGVTGTNGKSTVVELVAAILTAAGRPAGRLGTLGYRFGELSFDAERTTPEGSDYFRLLRAMRDAGAAAVVAEVSSHALAQGRVAGASYDLALFTNLTRDHLDFHADLEAYFAAKRQLFAMLKAGGRAVLNLDDPYGRRLAGGVPAAIGFGRGADAAVRPVEVSRDIDGTRGELDTPRGRLRFDSALRGDYNLDNLLAAVAAAEALELPRAAIGEGIAACRPLPGRMELVSTRGGFAVLVDYAHTDAALRAALESARRLAPGRLIVVFGCGGDRDPGKREPMGRLAGELADLAVVTSDNPRGESPEAIIAAVRRGLEASGGDYLVEPDRRAAIRRAVGEADEGALVLVAGKGHERTQTLRDRVIPFSDQEEILAALEERLGPSTAG
jgi:UDP-N-acetylmuramoyl-L-alanyl-D-glutamate--2,6-diaminopimelate ligase